MAVALPSPVREVLAGLLCVATCFGRAPLEAADCNENCIEDAEEIGFYDCNANGIPDDCDLKLPGADFARGSSFFPGGLPLSLDISDLDGDAFPDIITGNVAPLGPGAGFSIHFNDGQGRPEAPWSRMVPGCNPETLALADFDRDGDVDLALASYVYDGCRRAPDRVSVFENLAGREFAPARTFEAGLDAQDLQAADLDLDGDTDFVTVGLAPGQPALGAITVLRNRGDSSFEPAEHSPATTTARSLAATDLDGDGDSDLAVIFEAARHVSLHSNDGGGSFGPPASIPVADFIDSVLSDDLEGDGDLDLIISGVAGPGSLGVVLENPGGGSEWRREVVDGAGGACTADVDRDGLRDLVAPAEGDVRVFRNTGFGSFDESDNVYMQALTRIMNSADMDSDGDEDIVAFVGQGPVPAFVESIRVVRNDRGRLEGSLAIEWTGVPLEAADLDGDGDIDLATQGLLLRNSGTGRFPGEDRLSYGEPGNAVESLASGDLDGDAALDLVTASRDASSRSRLQVYRNQGAARFSTRTEVFSNGDSVRPRVSVADVDGDRDLDLVALAVRFQVSVFINEGGVFLAGERAVSGSDPIALATGDLDGDGLADAMTGNVEEQDTANVTVFRSSGRAFLTGRNYAVGSQAAWIALGDIDGDGDLDAATDGVHVLENDGRGTFESRRIHDAETLSGVCADLDGDGDLDLAAGNDTLLLNDGRGAFDLRTRPPQTEGRHLLAADLDGDRDVDLIEEGVSVAWNEGLGTFGAPWQTDVPAQARLGRLVDLDGDGDLDLTAASGPHAGFLDAIPAGGFASARWRHVVPGEFIVEMALVDMDRREGLDLVLVTAAFRRDSWRFGLVKLLDGLDPFSNQALDLGSLSGVDLDAADLDGDGDLDLALLGSTCTPECASTVFLALNDGRGTLSLTQIPDVPRWTESLVAADLDADGDLDLATDAVSVFLNRGGTFFRDPRSLYEACCGLAAGDVDRDGDTDLATGVAVFRNRGHGNAFDVLLHRTALGGDSTLGDVDSDGFPDLLGSIPNAYRVGLLVNDRKGTFDAAAWLEAATSVHFVEDLDADGKSDIVVLTSDGDFRIHWNRVAAPIALGKPRDLDSDGQIDDCLEGPFIRGDATGDRKVNLSDAIDVLRHLYQGAPEPGCLAAADMDHDLVVNVTDPIVLLHFLFRGGPPLPPPGPFQCGHAPNPSIECNAYPEC